MEKMLEEELPRIKPPFVLKTDTDRSEAKKWMINQEAEGKRPPNTRTAEIIGSTGKGNDRILVFKYEDIYLYMFNDEAPESIQSLSDAEVIGKRVSFKAVSKYEDRIVVSNKAISEFYQTALAHQKIMSGRIVDIKEGKQPYSHFAIVASKGDTVIIPSSEFLYPTIIPLKEMVGHIIDFVIIDVKDGKFVGSTKIVTNYREEQLEFFNTTKETFKARVEYVSHFGAFLTYKHNNSLILRNRDFSSNYTTCKDILSEGDTIDVRMKEITKNSRKFVVELTNKYNVEPTLNFNEIFPEQQYEGEIVSVEAFGAFVRISIGRDVLCPINFEKREPLIGDKVTIQIVVSNEELGRLRGKILKYNDNLPNLGEFNLIGDNYDY